MGQALKSHSYQALGRIFIIRNPAVPAAAWSVERKGVLLSGLGAAGLLQGTLTAFFASRQCPGSAIRAATTWVLQQVRDHPTLVGGFHSPLEESVLRLLLEAGGTAVLVLARPVASATLRSAWRSALDAGRMAVVSQSTGSRRLTEQAADDRNDLAAQLADEIVVAHASSGGRLNQQCVLWRAEGRNVRQLP
jgi:predicted Rossmann fold nucleotide-binding protein DprA/Smf involved in DNA uptake